MFAIINRLALAGVVLLASTFTTLAQGVGSGPVARECRQDIQAVCSNLKHGNRDIRACLEAKRSQLSAKCRWALDNTGGGWGRRVTPR